ncbi:MAG: hypothetical protein WC784_03205 [Candidatus Shapirobacteria bacterium]|jgi:hypothetical protein
MKVETSLNAILTSKTRCKLICLFFGNPQELFYVRQLVRLSGEEINSVRRELANLKKANILLSEARGNRLYYTTNSHHHLFNSLLLLAYRNSDLAIKLDKAKLLLVSFHFLLWEKARPDSIDLIIVGELPIREVENAIHAEEKLRGVEINYMVMDQSELKLRQNKRDPFIVDFFLSSPLVIIGNPALLEN